jgi:RND family efflux transporter MFP subunit
MKRKIVVIVVIVVLTVAFIAKLMWNKKEIDANASPKEIKVNVPVVVEEAKKSVIDNSFNVNGSFIASKELTIMSQTQGKIVKLNFDNGDFVKEGQLLVQADIELLTAQKELAEANMLKLKNDLKKFEDMYKSNAVTQQQVEDLKLAFLNAQTNQVTVNKQIEYAMIKAPFAGYISKKYVEKGGMLMPGSPVAELIDINTLKFIANVSESDVEKIKKGDAVKITADIYNGILYDGRIKSIGFKADDARRFPVEIEVKNNLSKPIKAGMYGNAYFECEGSHEALLIPRTAIVGSIKEPKVFIVVGNMAEARYLKLGAQSETNIEVHEGIKEGDKVVIAGQINLENGTMVQTVSKNK